ncbi:MAG: cell division protein FtsW [Gemmatimonadetes bacterium]|nr:cell division protein FtsW [Gemmatimonadota bacterium]
MSQANVRERWAMGLEARALILITAVLVALGLATLFSASALEALQKGSAPSTFFVKQLTGALAGIVLFAAAAKVDAQRLEQHAPALMWGAIVLMALTLVPGIGAEHLGSRRYLLGRSVQPAELMKIAVVIWTAAMVIRKGDQMRRLSKGMPIFLVMVGIPTLIAFKQPDYSMGLMFVLLMLLVLFAAGARIGHFVLLAFLGAPLLWHQVMQSKYFRDRITAFLGGQGARLELNEQQAQSLMAVGSGGWTGTGYGEGMQAYGWIPMGKDDFIAAAIGEEWGFLGLTLVVLAFATWTWLGFRIARKARSRFLQLVAMGLTATVAITAYVHIGVVINLLPNTGLTLPFFSNGRTNLVITLLVTGVLVNIGSVREKVYGELATDPVAAAG